MKKILIYIGIVSALLQVGCTKDFDALNTDPNQVGGDQLDPNFLITSSQFAYSTKGYGVFMFTSMWSQTLASTSSLQSNYQSNGDKYVSTSSTPDYLSNIWNNNYGSNDKFSTGAGNLANDAIKLTAADAAKSNINAVAIIMKQLIMQQITDTYGDVPYSQAFQGKEGITQPVYDKQKDIYDAMFAELQTAVGMLDAGKVLATGDMYYKGDVTKWKKFAYSLMLRMAMRLTKVDAVTAQKWAEAAAAGGTFADNSDNAFITTEISTSHQNNLASVYGTDGFQTKWSRTLINYLRVNNDPRLTVVAEISVPTETNGNLVPGIVDSSRQIGLPNGYDLLGGPNDISGAPGFPGATTGSPIGNYSRPRYTVYANQASPIFVLTYPETELLLAEAAARGWNVGGTAATHYASGVAAALTCLSTLGAELTISPATAALFATTHPLDISSLNASLKQINEQYWATTGIQFNYYEAYMNWKRSGYPVLTPVNFAGNFSNGTIPRRQLYPQGEATLNTANYNAAAGSITGGDTWTSRVWWDVAN
jgi:hypothetical protein